MYDLLAKVCSNFYKEEEILAARQLIDNAGVRLPKRQGSNRLRSTVEDLIKVVLKPSIVLPTFFALNLSRLPPVDLKNVDVSAILRNCKGYVMKFVRSGCCRMKLKS